jgi:hypothetical protein
MNRFSRIGLAAAVALAACDPKVTGNGVIAVVDRPVEPFDAVDISLGIEATVTAHAAVQRVTLSGDENLLQYLLTSVQAGVLVTRIHDIAGVASVHPLRLIAEVAALHAVRATEAAIVEVQGAGSTDPAFNFEVNAASAGHVLLQGTGGHQLSVTLSGASGLDASAYPVDTAAAALSGGSTLKVRTAGDVVGTAVGASRVEISGGGSCALLVLDLSSTCHAVP